MADTAAAPVIPSASAAPEAAPAVTVSSPSPTPDVAPALAAPVADAAAPAADAPIVEAPKAAETFLGSDAKPETPKDSTPATDAADGTVPAVEPTKEEGGQSDEPASPPAYEAFTLPADIKLDDAKLVEFTKDLGEFERLTKADHAEMQKFGQKLMDRYVAETQENARRIVDHFTNTWDKQKSDWKAAFESDPEIGGNRKETTVAAAREFIRTHGGDDIQQQEFRDLMEATGLGNHPAMIRMLARANTGMAEGKPLPASRPAQIATSKMDKRYKT